MMRCKKEINDVQLLFDADSIINIYDIISEIIFLSCGSLCCSYFSFLSFSFSVANFNKFVHSLFDRCLLHNLLLVEKGNLNGSISTTTLKRLQLLSPLISYLIVRCVLTLHGIDGCSWDENNQFTTISFLWVFPR